METFLILTCILASYVFGLMSGVIMMSFKNQKTKQLIQEQANEQAKELAKTRKNKVSVKDDKAWKPKLIDKKVDVSKAPFSKGNLSWKESVYKEA